MQSIVKHVLNKQQFSSILIVLQLSTLSVLREKGKNSMYQKRAGKISSSAGDVVKDYQISNDHVNCCARVVDYRF